MTGSGAMKAAAAGVTVACSRKKSSLSVCAGAVWTPNGSKSELLFIQFCTILKTPSPPLLLIIKTP